MLAAPSYEERLRQQAVKEWERTKAELIARQGDKPLTIDQISYLIGTYGIED